MTRGALLAVMWLNMAVMPCAMAFESGEHDCPHCPPADEQEMAGHHGHDQAKSPCATMQSECCDAEAATLESRADKSKKSTDAVYVVAPPAAGPVARPTTIATVADPPDPPDAFPPRHILFCVYLD